MKRSILYLLLIAMVIGASGELVRTTAYAQEDIPVNRFYLLPIENSLDGTGRGPKYFSWRMDPDPPGIAGSWGMMDYGFVPYALLVAKDISQANHDALILNSDVYAFPINLDTPVSDPIIDTFFENINLPTDWLTPATTYRELMRQTAGMFQFNQRYGGGAAGPTGGGYSMF